MVIRSELALVCCAFVLAAACGGDDEAGGGSSSSSGTGASGASGGSGGAGASTGGGANGGGLGTGGSGGEQPIVRVNTCLGPSDAALLDVSLPPGYCAWQWAADLPSARGITVDDDGNVLVVARGDSAVVALWDDDEDGISGPSERLTIATASGLNHGIVLHGGYLYASSQTTVYRWAYSPRQDLGASATVVTGLPSGGHSTRTLLFDAQDYLYVTIGSGGNVDGDSSRARMIRYPLADLEAGSVTFAQGEVFSDGMRNEVGIALDLGGRIWGVENGVDNLARNDLGGDIHNDNPGEELNLLDAPGAFYGYPYCFSEYLLPPQYAMGPGTQWAHPDFMNDGTHTDAWCRDLGNVVPPALSMQSHAAPLGILFYAGGSFPNDTVGDAFVTFHGSWNHTPAVGRSLMRVPFGNDGMPSGDPTPIFEYSGGDVNNFSHRPVAVAASVEGMLYVTSDSSSQVIAVGHDGT